MPGTCPSAGPFGRWVDNFWNISTGHSYQRAGVHFSAGNTHRTKSRTAIEMERVWRREKKDTHVRTDALQEFSTSCSFRLQSWEPRGRSHEAVELRPGLPQGKSEEAGNHPYCLRYNIPRCFEKSALFRPQCESCIASHLSDFRKAHNSYGKEPRVYWFYEVYLCVHTHMCAISRRVLTTLLVTEAANPFTAVWGVTWPYLKFQCMKIAFPAARISGVRSQYIL